MIWLGVLLVVPSVLPSLILRSPESVSHNLTSGERIEVLSRGAAPSQHGDTTILYTNQNIVLQNI